MNRQETAQAVVVAPSASGAVAFARGNGGPLCRCPEIDSFSYVPEFARRLSAVQSWVR